MVNKTMKESEVITKYKDKVREELLGREISAVVEWKAVDKTFSLKTLRPSQQAVLEQLRLKMMTYYKIPDTSNGSHFVDTIFLDGHHVEPLVAIYFKSEKQCILIQYSFLIMMEEVKRRATKSTTFSYEELKPVGVVL